MTQLDWSTSFAQSELRRNRIEVRPLPPPYPSFGWAAWIFKVATCCRMSIEPTYRLSNPPLGSNLETYHTPHFNTAYAVNSALTRSSSVTLTNLGTSLITQMHLLLRVSQGGSTCHSLLSECKISNVASRESLELSIDGCPLSPPLLYPLKLSLGNCVPHSLVA